MPVWGVATVAGYCPNRPADTRRSARDDASGQRPPGPPEEQGQRGEGRAEGDESDANLDDLVLGDQVRGQALEHALELLSALGLC